VLAGRPDPPYANSGRTWRRPAGILNRRHAVPAPAACVSLTGKRRGVAWVQRANRESPVVGTLMSTARR
jgi:hypothetical protein